MMGSKGTTTLVAGAMIGLTLANPASSQDSAPQAASADGTDILEEVIVTARRVEESVQDVPISITVFKQVD